MIYRVLFILSLVMLWPPPAHAYLDPGSGSMMVQLLLAGLAGVVVVVKMFWRRVLHFFGLSKDVPPHKNNPHS